MTTTNQDPAPKAPETPNTDGTAPSVAELLAKIEEQGKRLAEVSRESAERRTKHKEAQTAAEKALEEQGQFKALAEERAKRVAELEALEGDAKAYQALMKTKAEALAAKRETLPPAVLAAFDAAQGNLAAQEAIVNAFATAAPETPKPKNGPNLTTGGGTLDFAAAFADPTKWAEAKKADPEGAKKYFDSISRAGGAAPPGSILQTNAHRPVVRR
jgi:hypothetical protein